MPDSSNGDKSARSIVVAIIAAGSIAAGLLGFGGLYFWMPRSEAQEAHTTLQSQIVVVREEGKLARLQYDRDELGKRSAFERGLDTRLNTMERRTDRMEMMLEMQLRHQGIKVPARKPE